MGQVALRLLPGDNMRASLRADFPGHVRAMPEAVTAFLTARWQF